LRCVIDRIIRKCNRLAHALFHAAGLALEPHPHAFYRDFSRMLTCFVPTHPIYHDEEAPHIIAVDPIFIIGANVSSIA
jgi:hypothetical protein